MTTPKNELPGPVARRIDLQIELMRNVGTIDVDAQREVTKCLRDEKHDQNMQGPCSAGQCQWPNCKPAN